MTQEPAYNTADTFASTDGFRSRILDLVEKTETELAAPREIISGNI